jgi:heme exporter protein D
MYFDSLFALWNMNGHGVYVWTAYGVSILCFSILIALIYIKKKKLIAQLQHQYKQGE